MTMAPPRSRLPMPQNNHTPVNIALLTASIVTAIASLVLEASSAPADSPVAPIARAATAAKMIVEREAKAPPGVSSPRIACERSVSPRNEETNTILPNPKSSLANDGSAIISATEEAGVS